MTRGPAAVGAPRVAPAPSLSAHYRAARLRTDTWNEFKNCVDRLAEKRIGEEEAREQRRRALEIRELLEPIESYWAFPGMPAFRHMCLLFEQGEFGELAAITSRTVRAISNHSYRRRHIPLLPGDDWAEGEEEDEIAETAGRRGAFARPYFEVLVVDALSPPEEAALREGIRETRRTQDKFVYDLVVVPSFEDAVIAALFNFNIQSVVVRHGFPFRSRHRLEVLQQYLSGIDDASISRMTPAERGTALGSVLAQLRPELDLFLATDVSVEELASTAGQIFRRIFYRQEDYLELHLSILRGIEERFRTPFFTALREYADKPTGVFHAMPISRGKSLVNSHWIRDMADFYGLNIFLAETSSTSGGLDSLLDPKGSIKEAQEAAARAFGARRTFFVTNGTSTANKIVVQALARPGDIALVDRDCHKSHHYTLVLAGAQVVYLDSYPLHDWSFYGAVPLASIKRHLLELKAAGKLDRVRMLLLTNCTFDGIVYDPERVMHECLAIKPDLVFVWDEAWFAFARFSPLYRRRTAMAAARVLRDRYRSPEYAAAWAASDEAARAAMPDPDQVRVRVYATQSTHKTLTSLRQGSMIHVFDQDWGAAEHAFHDAYMTHTSTSPNYQILASLDVGRRQCELEGFEMVAKQIELAMVLREKVAGNPLLSRWFRFLPPKDMIPAAYRPSGMEAYYDAKHGWAPMEQAWVQDEFVLDPTRLTLFIGRTGIDGDTFRRNELAARYGIQINKTSRNTVLFMTNIGTTRSSVAHLIEVLVRMAHRLDEEHEDDGPAERRAWEEAVAGLTTRLPPLPDFSRFHDVFRGDPGGTPEGHLRRAFMLTGDEALVEYVPIGGPIEELIASGREPVSAGFVTPYPPGFPILVPGQVVSADIVAYMCALDTKEIHGYRPEFGLRIFTEAALERARKESAR